jgi:hypothetical protein
MRTLMIHQARAGKSGPLVGEPEGEAGAEVGAGKGGGGAGGVAEGGAGGVARRAATAEWAIADRWAASRDCGRDASSKEYAAWS